MKICGTVRRPVKAIMTWRSAGFRSTRTSLMDTTPRCFSKALARTPGIVGLHDRVAALPKVAAYLRSERRLPFSEQDLFRRYPELDLAL